MLHSLKNSKQYKVIAQAVLLAYKGIRGVVNDICDGENKLVAKYNKCSLKKKNRFNHGYYIHCPVNITPRVVCRSSIAAIICGLTCVLF